LATGVVADARDRGEVQLIDMEPVEGADIAIALTKGLEGDLTDADLIRRRLKPAVGLLIGGLQRS